MTLHDCLTELRNRLLDSGDWGIGWSATADATVVMDAMARIATLEAALREAIQGHEVWEGVYGSSASSREHLAYLKLTLGTTAETDCGKAE